MTRVTAFAPASIGNLGVGFDMLGLALSGVGDRVTAERTASPGVVITEIFDPDGKPHEVLRPVAEENTASIAAAALWQHGKQSQGLALTVHKGTPLLSGMGSSAASAVAGVVAANALLDEPLPVEQLLPFALAGEQYASGGLHADNVAPSLLGGLVLCPPALLPQVVSLPVPEHVQAVLLHPALHVSTAESRRALRDSYSRDEWLLQQGYLATFIAGCAAGDLDLLKKGLTDALIEPQRASQVSCFNDVKAAAMSAGALGCSLSGSGPSIFALAHRDRAEAVAEQMVASCEQQGVASQVYLSPLDAPGAYVED